MKERLDVLLVKRNLAESREKAKAVIMAGCVFVDGQREDKAGTTFSPDVNIVDVGRGQLDWKLRQDPRVICMEKTNIRYVTPEDIGEPVDFSSIDVSFISLTKVLEPIRNYLKADGEIVALIKPQFEAGREKVGKKGVVREKSTHREVIEKVTDYARSVGFDVLELDFSPIKGPEGNIEYLVHLKKNLSAELSEDSIDIASVVDRAFETLAK